MAVVANIALSLTARTSRFNRAMAAAQKRLKRFRGAAHRTARAMTKLSTGFLGASIGAVAVAAGFKRLVMTGEELERSMNRSLAIMGDVSLAMRQKMTGAAIELAKQTKSSAKEIAESYFFLASAGLSAAQSLKAIPLVAKFAQAGMFNLSQATDLLTDAQSALGLSSKDAELNLKNMTRVADVLVKANTLANASVEQFSRALTTKAGAALKFANKSLEEGVAILAAYADQGIKAEEAGTAMNVVLRDLQTKALQNAAVFEEFGVRVFDSTGNMVNMATTVRDLERALDGMGVAQKKATLLQLGFSDKTVVFMQTLIGASDKLTEWTDKLNDAAGAVDEVAKKQLTALEEKLNKLSGAWAGLSAETVYFNHVLQIAAGNTAKRLNELTIVANVLNYLFGISASPTAKVGEGALKAVADAEKAAAAAAEKLARTEEHNKPTAREKALMKLAQEEQARNEQLAHQRMEIAESLLQPVEIFRKEMDKLNALFKYGRIESETYRRAVERVTEQYERDSGILARREAGVEDAAQATIDRLNDYWANRAELQRLLDKQAAGGEKFTGRFGLESASTGFGSAAYLSQVAGARKKSPELEELVRIRQLQEQIARQQRQGGGLSS